eukprot:11190290-Lingulodinium_polyedra.AAC.1
MPNTNAFRADGNLPLSNTDVSISLLHSARIILVIILILILILIRRSSSLSVAILVAKGPGGPAEQDVTVPIVHARCGVLVRGQLC